EQIEHAVDRPVRAVAQRILLYAETLAQDLPVPSRGNGAFAIGPAVGGNGGEKAQRVLECVRRGGKPGRGQARGDDAGVGGPPGGIGPGDGGESGERPPTVGGAGRGWHRGPRAGEAAHRGGG